MLGIVMSIGLAAAGQAADDAKPKAAWVELAREHVAQCVLSSTADPDRTFTMKPEPVFQHVQHVRGNATGSLFVWVDASWRPVAICDVFFLPKKGQTFTMYHEWHSLTAEALTARLDASLVWNPSTAGLTWQEVPNASAPGVTAAQLKRQLREIAGRFTAHLVEKKGGRFELRRITTPLYQFVQEDNADSRGGALFTFCQENDPEALLMLEALRTKDGFRWHYAPAEFSNLSHFLHLDGKEVWKAAPPTFSATGPHFGTPVKTVEVPAVEETGRSAP